MWTLARLAARNLRRNTRRSAITIAAIAFGLSVTVVAINLANGQYKAIIRAGISSLAGDVVVQGPGYGEARDQSILVPRSSEVAATLAEAFPGATIARRASLGGLLMSPTSSVAAGLQAVEPGPEAAVNTLDEAVFAGSWLADGDDRGIVIGERMALSLGVEPGDKLVFTGASPDGEVTSRLFRVAGLFRTGAADLDGFVGVIPLGAAQEILQAPDAAHQITVHLQDADRDGDDTDAARARDALAGQGLEVLAWREALPEVWAFIQVDRSTMDGMMAILGLIVALGVLNTVLMSVMERVRELGVMMAIGVRPRQVAWMVLFEGLALGVLGAVGGVALGALLSWPIAVYGIDYTAFMGESTTMSGVSVSAIFYAEWDAPRVLRYAAVTAAVTVLAAAWPAWWTTRLTPVDAIRHT